MRLQSNVSPMPFDEVLEVIESSYGCPWEEIFERIEETPLGSASIAQVHKAMLKDRQQVVVKVQRKGIYETMARDIGLLRKAVRLLQPISLKGMVDLDMVLEELWDVTRQEMNFLKESDEVEVTSFEGEVLGVSLPINVPFKIIETEPAVKGDTATGATKNATIETGYQIKVPLFISEGETVIVSTVDGKYQGRA